VLLADDQVLVRTGLRMIIDDEADLDVVGEAADGHEAISRAQQLRPDVVLMDIRMPGLDGISATREILRRPGVAGRVLILTTFDADEHVYSALAAGASGFLLKDTKADVLTDAIRTVHAGDALLAPGVTRRLVARFVAAGRGAVPDDRAARLGVLTAREREVLVMVARGLSNHEIAQILVLSEATVKTHLGRIFTKLDLRDRAQAVVLAYETGLVTPGG
jgi:DNA-binding NarL/FixJ family response regulator